MPDQRGAPPRPATTADRSRPDLDWDRVAGGVRDRDASSGRSAPPPRCPARRCLGARQVRTATARQIRRLRGVRVGHGWKQGRGAGSTPCARARRAEHAHGGQGSLRGPPPVRIETRRPPGRVPCAPPHLVPARAADGLPAEPGARDDWQQTPLPRRFLPAQHRPLVRLRDRPLPVLTADAPWQTPHPVDGTAQPVLGGCCPHQKKAPVPVV